MEYRIFLCLLGLICEVHLIKVLVNDQKHDSRMFAHLFHILEHSCRTGLTVREHTDAFSAS